MTNKRHMKRRRTKKYKPCLKKKKADINMSLIAENLLPFAFRIFSFSEGRQNRFDRVASPEVFHIP